MHGLQQAWYGMYIGVLRLCWLSEAILVLWIRRLNAWVMVFLVCRVSMNWWLDEAILVFWTRRLETRVVVFLSV